MITELLTEDDFDSLPEEPDARFAAIESLCRRKFVSEVHPANDDEESNLLRLEYMTIVAEVAEEYGIEGFEKPYNMPRPLEEFTNFMLKANGRGTRYRLRNSTSRQNTVQLANSTRSQIELQIDKLRRVIAKSDIPKTRRDLLLRKLDELSSEMFKPRASFAKVMALLAYVSAGVGGATGFLADAPEAIATISSLIGADKEAEEENVRRLASEGPRKALPPPSGASESGSDEDNELPF